jgi:hypothetical protein
MVTDTDLIGRFLARPARGAWNYRPHALLFTRSVLELITTQPDLWAPVRNALAVLVAMPGFLDPHAPASVAIAENGLHQNLVAGLETIAGSKFVKGGPYVSSMTRLAAYDAIADAKPKQPTI